MSKAVLLRMEFADLDLTSDKTSVICGVDLRVLGPELGMPDQNFSERILLPMLIFVKAKLQELRPDLKVEN